MSFRAFSSSTESGKLRNRSSSVDICTLTCARDQPHSSSGSDPHSEEGRRWGTQINLGRKASAEQFGPHDLVELAVYTEHCGMDSVVVSERFYPGATEEVMRRSHSPG